MMKRLPASALLEQAIQDLLEDGIEDGDRLSQLGRLSAQFVLQRAVEDEVTVFLARARYQRTPEARGWRNGARPKRLQTAEGELVIQMPQLRGTLETFVCRTIPDTRAVVRTRPLEALIIGAYVRGLSDRDVESLVQEAGLGSVPRSSVSRICQELRERYKAFCAHSLAEIELLALFLAPSTCRPGPAAPRRGSWWPGATTSKANATSWRSAWANANVWKTGWSWAVT